MSGGTTLPSTGDREIALISRRGGPAAMLKASKPTQLAEGVTMSPARMMLEILAIYETFGEYLYCKQGDGADVRVLDSWRGADFDQRQGR